MRMRNILRQKIDRWYFFLLKKKKFLERNIFPLEHLDGAEKSEALRIARQSIKNVFLNKGEYRPECVLRRFFESGSACVAVWTDGKLRGSRVMNDRRQPLWHNITEAAVCAARDARFVALTAEELSKTRIEVTIFLNNFRRLSDREIAENRIDPRKGYRIVSKDGRMGWYLPEVFNILRFRDLKEFLISLATQKAGLTVDDARNARVEIFDVDDCIESEKRDRILTLSGPVIIRDDCRNISDRVSCTLETAVKHLISLQEADGNIPPIIRTLSGKKEVFDGVRLAFVASALALYGRERSYVPATEAAEKALTYLDRIFLNDVSKDQSLRILASAYVGEALFFLGRHKEAYVKVEEIIREVLPEEPILLLKVAALCALFEKDPKRIGKARTIFERVWNRLETMRKDGTSIELACFPELLPLGLRLSEITGKEEYRKKAEYIGDWFLSFRLPDGSFSSSINDRFSYTRGTGKIFESLAAMPERYGNDILPIWDWLEQMQYDSENAYFVDDHHQNLVLGGFRHDMLDQNVWIDASGHIIIGGVRWLKHLGK